MSKSYATYNVYDLLTSYRLVRAGSLPFPLVQVLATVQGSDHNLRCAIVLAHLMTCVILHCCIGMQ